MLEISNINFNGDTNGMEFKYPFSTFCIKYQNSPFDINEANLPPQNREAMAFGVVLPSGTDRVCNFYLKIL